MWETPRFIKDRTAIQVMLATLDVLDESYFRDFKTIWLGMDALFSHQYSEQLRVRAIAESKYWPLLLDGLK